MCQARLHQRRVPHEQLEQLRSATGYLLKSAGGAVKQSTKDKAAQTDGPLRQRNRFMLPASLTVLAALLLNHVGLFVPLVMMTRNCLMPKKPVAIEPKYPACPAELLEAEVTIVVSVKDACSQAPGFIRSLERFAPPGVHLIYTFPNFESCANIDLKGVLARWKKVTLLPLPLRVSPMQGWVDAIPHIRTKYSYLVHNDGYALDSFFGCELLRGLEAHKLVNSSYALAAPMLYESKADGSLAAHATQTNLRLVKDGSPQGMTVHHDHSLRRALNRGQDFQEGPQTEFIEDHGFLIESDKISTVIDPRASFTLEYLDMIMTIRAKGWKVLFVPTARLEFRITEFSWRDIPYFMYKRSEATAHGTRDYLKAKWRANFPNTGFWTYIKYTIVEQHVYDAHYLSPLAWKDQAALAFGFFQMAGYNRYSLTAKRAKPPADFLEVLQRLDRRWAPPSATLCSRQLARPAVIETRPAYVSHLDEILPYGQGSGVEADFTHEYLPFAVARLTVPSCDVLPAATEAVCGVLVERTDGCDCWVNMPTFKSNSLFVRAMSLFAAAIKVPSRITTFIEMALGAGHNATEHVAPLRAAEAASAGAFELYVCNVGDADCTASFSFPRSARLRLFRGAPAAIHEVQAALAALAAF